MALPDLPLQAPAGSPNPPGVGDSTASTVSTAPTNSTETPSSPMRYFWSSWPDLYMSKIGKPKLIFSGRFMQSDDPAKAEWILELAEMKLPFSLKELTEQEYLDGKYEEQLATSHG